MKARLKVILGIVLFIPGVTISIDVHGVHCCWMPFVGFPLALPGIFTIKSGFDDDSEE